MTTQIVKVLADSDLKQNGGQFSVEGNVAQPVINVGSSPKRALGGSAKPVYVVTQAQIDNGSYGFRGGPSLEVADMDVVGSQLKVEQSAAMPVYVVSGDALGISETFLLDNIANVQGVYSIYKLRSDYAGNYADIARKHTITAVNTTSETFTVSGDVTLAFTAGKTFVVYGSTGNDGTWTVQSSSYSNPNTTITVSEDVTDATVDGTILITESFGVASDNILDVASVSSWLNGFQGYWKKWYDQSGNDYHAEQTDNTRLPVYTADAFSGLPGAVFDDVTNSGLFIPAALLESLTACTVFTIQQLDSDAAKSSSMVIAKADASTQQLFYVSLLSGGGNAVGKLDGAFGYSSGVRNATSTPTFTWSDTHQVTMRASNGNPIELFVDGTEVSGYDVQDNAVSIPASFTNTPAIGQNSSATSTADFEGKISCIILVGASLSDADRAAIETGLGDIW